MAKATTGKPKQTEKSTKQGKSGSSGKPSLFARFGGYLRDVRSEMKRVVWPSRPEVLNSSVVVVVTLVFFIAFIALTDFIVVEALGLLS
jgi:preprotein translocase subunit SecE